MYLCLVLFIPLRACYDSRRLTNGIVFSAGNVVFRKTFCAHTLATILDLCSILRQKGTIWSVFGRHRSGNSFVSPPYRNHNIEYATG